MGAKADSVCEALVEAQRNYGNEVDVGRLIEALEHRGWRHSMAKTAGEYTIPFDKFGNLLHYAEPDRPATSYYGAAEWRENVPFTALIEVKDYSRGRSAAYIDLLVTGHNRRTFNAPMFLCHFVDMLRKVSTFNGSVEEWHTFKARKCGRNYGLVMIE